MTALDTAHPPVKVTDAQYDKVWKIHQQVLTLRREIEERFLSLGRTLSVINKHQLYKYLGYDTFAAYCAQPELGISRSTAYRLTAIWEELATRQSLPHEEIREIGMTKAGLILRFYREDRDPEEQQEWAEKAKALSVGDLRKEIRRDRATRSTTLIDVLEDAELCLRGYVNRIPDASNPIEHFMAMIAAAEQFIKQVREVTGGT